MNLAEFRVNCERFRGARLSLVCLIGETFWTHVIRCYLLHLQCIVLTLWDLLRRYLRPYRKNSTDALEILIMSTSGDCGNRPNQVVIQNSDKTLISASISTFFYIKWYKKITTTRFYLQIFIGFSNAVIIVIIFVHNFQWQILSGLPLFLHATYWQQFTVTVTNYFTDRFFIKSIELHHYHCFSFIYCLLVGLLMNMQLKESIIIYKFFILDESGFKSKSCDYRCSLHFRCREA